MQFLSMKSRMKMMNLHSHSSNAQYAWASVIGPSHILNELPNQDACAVLSLKEGMAFVVSDGVGSKKHSDIGSKEVIKAVKQAIKTWYQFPHASANHLLSLIHTYWEMGILPYDRDDCSATCLFAVILNDNRCIIGQVGDGVILFKLGKDHYVLHEKEDDYVNVTLPLHLARRKDWKIEDFFIDDSFEILLATDGVSEDLIKEKRFHFMTDLVEKISDVKGQKKKNSKIKNMLKKWGNPYNSDDKSLIIYSRRVMNGKYEY